jgi:hypothetical protein
MVTYTKKRLHIIRADLHSSSACTNLQVVEELAQCWLSVLSDFPKVWEEKWNAWGVLKLPAIGCIIPKGVQQVD